MFDSLDVQAHRYRLEKSKLEDDKIMSLIFNASVLSLTKVSCKTVMFFLESLIGAILCKVLSKRIDM